MDWAAVKSEFTTDPTGLGYAGKSDSEIRILYSSKIIVKQNPVAMSDVIIWAAENSVVIPLQAVAQATGPLQNAAAAFLLAISGSLPTLDVSNPRIDGMISAFVTAGVFTVDQKAALYVMGQTTVSRADQTFGELHEGDIGYALRTFNG